MSKATNSTPTKTANNNGNNNTNKNSTPSYYDQNKANIMRLKVNKVNLIQKLDPDDDLITRLISVKVLTYEEAASIMSGRGREEKSRNLITTLIGKYESSSSQASSLMNQSSLSTAKTTTTTSNDSSRNKTLKKDWYYLFRKSLHEQGYAELVTFLDNTIINKPKFVEKFSSMSSGTQLHGGQREQASVFSRESADDDEVTEIRTPKPSKSFKYKTKASYLIDELKSSKDPNDLKQLTAEIEAYELFKQLEKLVAESSSSSFSSLPSNRSPSSSETDFFLDSLVLKNILDLADTHMYIKYYKQYAESQKVDLLGIFARVIMESFARDKVIRLRFYSNLDELVHKLAWTFLRNERPKLADEMLNEYLNYIEFLENYVDKLQKENSMTAAGATSGGEQKGTRSSRSLFNDNSRFILLISKLNTISNLIIVKNALSEFTSSLELYKSGKELLGLANECMLCIFVNYSF